MAKNDIIITPTSDLFIASLWSAPKNEPILRSLLSGVMTNIGQPPVAEATVKNPFNIQEFPVDKQIRLDVLVKDELGAIYDVEVQREKHDDFFERMLQYWGETYSSQVQRGDNYNQLRPMRSIIITEFPVFPLLKRLHAVFELRSRENPDVLFSDHCQIHVLRLGDLLRNLSGLDQFGGDLQCWMQLWAFGSKLEESKMSAMLQDSPAVLQAYEEFKQFSADDEMREKVRARERFLNDQYLDRANAYHKGQKEGVIEGEAKKARETAQNMKREGFGPALIARMTGLPVSEVERLN
jgi:predicted transposase/invertase (TIGR01784 family)